MRMIYLANVRLPTEKAHGLQIMQNCEAFAQAGVQVSLWVAGRVNTPEMRQVADVHTHYGVAPVFDIQRLPTLDLLPLVPGRSDRLAQLIFYVQVMTFTLMAMLRLLFAPAEVIYTRDRLLVIAARLAKPQAKVVYEAHQLAVGGTGQRLQRAALQRAHATVALTPPLRDDLATLAGDGLPPARLLSAHDGIRARRFESVPPQDIARQRLGWQQDAFIVGYVGRLQTLNQDKGVGTLVNALAEVAGASIALVGGPDEMADALRAHWLSLGLSPERFLYAGQVTPEAVPGTLAAFDICVMPLPYTPHFARHASPLKLFEYMASGRALIATDLPGWADVVQHEHNALLVPPGDARALATAIIRLQNDPALRQRLATQAQQDVMTRHTWDARARSIVAHLQTPSR